MHVRSISPAEVDTFAAVGPHSLGTEGFAQYIRELWQLGVSRPDACFIVEDGSQIVGRVLYRGSTGDVNFTGLSLPWQADYLTMGTLLFRESLQRVHAAGAQILEAFIPSAWPYADQARDLMQHLRLPLIQTKFRYVGAADAVPDSRLIFRTLDEVGEDTFIEAIRRSSTGTLDALDQLQLKAMGAEAHARAYFDVLKTEFEFHPAWWLAAYTPAAELVGHVVGVPYNLHRQEGAIGYIGVVPEQRGHRYGDELLRAGMQAMHAAGVTTVIADTDLQNVPMQQSFERCGYQRTDTTWVYRETIATLLQ